jgi:hypothetical protein
MTKRLIGPVILVCALSLPLLSFDSPSAPVKKVGYALLDMYVTCFHEMATKGTGGPGSNLLEKNLEMMENETKKAKDQAEIDPYFYTHFSRLLALTKLLVTPDPAKILKPMIDQEVADFIKDVTGEDLIASGGAPAIGQVAGAMTEEIINLQIYLDTLDKREALRRKFGMSLSGPQK